MFSAGAGTSSPRTVTSKFYLYTLHHGEDTAGLHTSNMDSEFVSLFDSVVVSTHGSCYYPMMITP